MFKKTISSILILMMACIFFLSGCTQEETPEDKTDGLKEKIDFKIDAYLTDLMDSKESMKSNEQIAEHIRHWAKSKGVSYKEDEFGNITMHKDTSEEYAAVPLTYIICPYDHKQFDSFIYPMALSFYCIKNNESTGNLSVIFTPEDAHKFTGLKEMKKGSLHDDANIICLNASEKGLFSMKTGASTVYNFRQKIKRTSPKYNRGYVISLKGLPRRQPDSRISEVPNPIMTLESLLANLKNANVGYEIAGFTGGTDDMLYASEAELTIVVDPDKESKFTERMDRVISSWNEKYGDKYQEAVYSYEPVKLPSSVLSKADANKLVSYMYTLLNGEYYRNEDGELVSINCISKIVTGKKAVKVSSVAYSLDETSLGDIDMDEETLCSLSGITFDKVAHTNGWQSFDNSDLSVRIADAFKESTSKNLTYSPSVTSTIASPVSDITDAKNIISITVNDNILKDCTHTVIRYLIDLNQPPEK